MPRFPIHQLHDTEFENLLTLNCHHILGVGVTLFAPGPDSGKTVAIEKLVNDSSDRLSEIQKTFCHIVKEVLHAARFFMSAKMIAVI